jgi:hypothetical protein
MHNLHGAVHTDAGGHLSRLFHVHPGWQYIEDFDETQQIVHVGLDRSGNARICVCTAASHHGKAEI